MSSLQGDIRYHSAVGVRSQILSDVHMLFLHQVSGAGGIHERGEVHPVRRGVQSIREGARIAHLNLQQEGHSIGQ